jgi:hypothetical protein
VPEELRLLLEVCDDGRGVDWDGLRRRANSLGLPAVTESDLVEAMFIDGVSTRAEASLVSGHGVGLAAVRQAVVDLGGAVKVVSQPRLGTRNQVTCPRWLRQASEHCVLWRLRNLAEGMRRPDRFDLPFRVARPAGEFPVGFPPTQALFLQSTLPGERVASASIYGQFHA